MKRSVMVVFLAVLLLLPATSHAAFPGANGKIAFHRGEDIWTMNPDGTGQVNLTDNASTESHPAWSPDGKQIAFDRLIPGPAFQRQLIVMNADGTGASPVPTPSGRDAQDPAWSPDGTQLVYIDFGAGSVVRIKLDGTDVTYLSSGDAPFDPEWSPDGTRIAFSDDGQAFNPNCIEDTYVMDAADGGNGYDLTCGIDENEFNTDPNWSPDAQRIAFGRDGTCTPGPNCRPTGITTVKADGTDQQFVNNGGVPAYSPDGTKIVSGNGAIYIMNTDGTGLTPITSGTPPDSFPDWQPIPINSYPRPKGATPLRASLTTAYKQCTAPDRTHGPPLAFPSCASPQKSSAHLTVGTGDSNGLPARNEGSVTLTTIVGAPGAPDDADVAIQVSMDDVFTNALADYGGEIRAHVALRITDKDNTPHPGGPGAATTTEIPLDVIAPCIGLAGPADGSVCTVSTTADALAPGAVKEARRTIWQLGRVELYDGGADGDANTTTGDTLFATQGIFIP